MATDALPTEDEVYEMTQLTEQMLKENGYVHYEVSNFAQPGYACRHNIGYWTRVNYLGLGLGASSLMENIRYTNTRDLYTYLEQVEVIREGIWEINMTTEQWNSSRQPICTPLLSQLANMRRWKNLCI